LTSSRLPQRLAKRVFEFAGLSVHRKPDGDPKRSLLADGGARSVLDVGANEGQYGRLMRRAGFSGPIVSFEPQSAAFAELERNSSKDRNWKSFRCALGAADGVITLNIAGNSESSSVLPMLELHSANSPTSAYVATEEVPLRRLDGLLLEAGVTGPFHLKLDVQGFELSVLDGASNTLDEAMSLEVEMSFAPLYGGQATFDALFDRIRAAGFEFYDVVPGFRAKNGRLLQIDGLFLRRSGQ
jgi:FkbM family methyltransferase